MKGALCGPDKLVPWASTGGTIIVCQCVIDMIVCVCVLVCPEKSDRSAKWLLMGLA